MPELDLAKLREDALYSIRKAEEISTQVDDDGLLSDEQVVEMKKLQEDGKQFLAKVEAIEATQEMQRNASDTYNALLKPRERRIDQTQPGSGDGVTVKILEVPSTHPKRYASFKGKDAERNAHKTGLWLRANIFGDPLSRMRDHKNVSEAIRHIRDYFPEIRALETTTNAAGGALVPQEMAAAVIERREQFGTYEKLTNRQTINAQALFPRITSDQAASFSAEGGTITEANLTLDNVSLNPKPMTTISKMSNQLIQASAVDLAELVTQDFGRRFAKRLDLAGFNGGLVAADNVANGGIKGAVHVIQETTGLAGNILMAGDQFIDVSQANITSMLAALPEYAHFAEPFWICHSAGKEAIFGRLQMASGGVTKKETTLGTFDQYQGVPIITSQVMKFDDSSDFTTNDVVLLLADLRLGSYLGISEELTIATSVDRYFDTDQTAMRGVMNADIINYDIGGLTSASLPAGSIVGLRSA